jgi:uncharacterized SAM-binding protein YcdF (DUF218 family)
MVRRRVKVRGPKFGNLLLFLIGVVGLWWIGLFRFVEAIPEKIVDPETGVDAIVVLTGGSGRLDAGLDLLDDNKASRLFVSGVYKGMEVRQLLTLSEKGRSNLEPRIDIGNAVDTLENAIETADWMVDKEIKSIRLVTAAYHMPRSLLEFENAMPGVVMIPNPVFPNHVKQKRWYLYPGTAMLISSEFNKFLLAWARNWVDHLFYGRGLGAKVQGLVGKLGKSSD